MAARIEHRASFAEPAPTVYAALVDKAFLTDRLAAIGGNGATLIEHSAGADSAEFALRQGVSAEHLPSAARTFLKGDLVVEREERWQADGDGYRATLKATVRGIPGEITGLSRLVGTELVTNAEVRVGIPLVGGKLEKLIAEQVGKLLATESEFAVAWLAEHRG